MTWKRFEANTPVLIQGMTGKEGLRMSAWLIASGVNVVGGVTPGKAGQTVEDRPIFDTVAALRAQFPEAVTSCIVVPATRVLSAAHEAIEAGVTSVYILAENVPVHDVLAIRRLAKDNAVILGPSSVGYLQFPQFRLGYVGGENPFTTIHEGSLAILSGSGGMTNELMMAATRAGLGIRLALAVGGDRIPGLSLSDAVRWAEAQTDVSTLLVYAEPGNPLIKQLVDGNYRPTKPFILFLAGDILDELPRGVPYGHTGTLLGEEDQSMTSIRTQLHAQGITCVKRLPEAILTCTTYAHQT